jgi:hypothetical protein
MNERTFLKQFAESADRDRMVSAVYLEFVQYCENNGITEDELSSEEIDELAEGFVDRGLSFSQTEELQNRFKDESE